MMFRFASFYQRFSILKSVKPGQTIAQTNPFRNKSFKQLGQLINSQQIKHQPIAVQSLILKSITQRIQSRKDSLISKRDIVKKIFNECAKNMIERVSEMKVSQIKFLISAIVLMDDYRDIRLVNQHRDQLNDRLSEAVQKFIENDKGQNLDQFYELFFLLLKFRAKGPTPRSLFVHLTKTGLSTSQQILKFFQQIVNYPSNFSYYSQIQKLFIKYINFNQNNSSSEWLQPLILSIISLYELNHSENNHQYINIFLDSFEIALNNGSIPFKTKSIFLHRLIQLTMNQSASIVGIDSHRREKKLVKIIFSNISQEFHRLEEINIQSLIELKQMCEDLINFSNKYCVELGVSSSQFEKQTFILLEKCYRKVFGKQGMKKFETKDLINLVFKNFTFSEECELDIFDNVLEHLKNNENFATIIRRIRLYEYLALVILQNKIPYPKQGFIEELKKISAREKEMGHFVLVRIYNICRLLGIRQKNVEENFNISVEKIPEGVIENLSRTILKPYSIDLIMKICDGATEKKCFWMSFKGSNKNVQNINNNSLYEYWFVKNWAIFKQCFSNFENSQYIAKFSSRECVLKSSFSSIQAEVSIDVLNYFYNSLTPQRLHKYIDYLQFSLTTYCKGEKIISILKKEHRHSYFVKMMWANIWFVSINKVKNVQPRTRALLVMINNIIGINQFSCFRDQKNLKLLLPFQFITQINSYKLGNSQYLINFWKWANFHGLNCERFQDLNRDDGIKKILKKKFGTSYLIEFLISSSQSNIKIQPNLLQQSKFPQDLYNGQINQNSRISDLQMLEFLSFPHSLQNFLRKNDNCASQFFKKLVQIKVACNCENLIKAKDLFEKFRLNVSKQVQNKFKEWIKTNAEAIYHLNQKLFSLTCLKLGLQPTVGVQSIDKYIRTQLISGNFFQVHLFYRNMKSGISKQVWQFVKLVKTNRVLHYLKEKSKNLMLMLINNIFGLVLLQKDAQLLQYFLDQNIDDILFVLEEKNDHEMDILLTLASNVLKQLKWGEIMDSILASFDRNKALFEIAENNKKIVELQFKDKFVFEDIQSLGISLPKIEEQLVLVSQEKTGLSSLIVEFMKLQDNLSKCSEYTLEQVHQKIKQQ